MAKLLENAARDADINRIEASHDIFLKEWRSYREKLEGFQYSPKQQAHIEKLSVLVTNMDNEQAEIVIKELRKMFKPQ